MATTYSLGFTPESASAITMQIPTITKSNYAVLEGKQESTLRRVVGTPTNQQEKFSFKTWRLSSPVSLSFKRTNGSRSKLGYGFSAKLENFYRVTQDDGKVYDEPFKITLTCEASDGTFNPASGAAFDGISNGYDWCEQIQRLLAMVIERVDATALENGAGSIKTGEQKQIDNFMHDSTKVEDVIALS